MITVHNISSLNMRTLVLRGLSTDTKPIKTFEDTSMSPHITRVVGNGSTFVEVDTGTCYMYDETNERWNETGSGGGGGDAQTASEEDIEGIIDSIWD